MDTKDEKGQDLPGVASRLAPVAEVEEQGEQSIDLSDAFSAMLPAVPDLDYKEEDRARMQSHENFLADNPGAFVGVSLAKWLEHVKASGIPHVPASQYLHIDRETVMHAENTEDPSHLEQIKALQARLKDVPAWHMVRWDACAPLDVKQQLQSGNTQVPPSTLDLFDPRAYDILFEYPLKVVPIFVRPWIEHKTVDGYPIEFRVFVEDGEIKGVANYYIQRALPETEEILDYVATAADYTEEILKQLHRTESYPWMPSYARRFNMEDGRIHATLDFMVDKDGQVLFLEAGPPFGAGAHPCAFMGKEISGVALGAIDQ